MQERATGRIELKHIKLQTGRDLLHYLYDRQLREGADLEVLLPVADQYDLKVCCRAGL
jgi:hypothetical protein